MKRLIFKIITIFFPCRDNNYKPRFLESRFLFYYVVAILILKIIAFSFILYFPKTIFFADVSQITLIELTNQERKAMGLPALKENPQLDYAARQKAQNMLDYDYFAHQSPSGVSPWHWFKTVGYNYKLAGENLAIGFLDSEEVVQAWKDSPSHRKNLLNPDFQEIGIAVLTGEFQGAETTVVVQHFAFPKEITGETAEEKENAQTTQEEEKPTEVAQSSEESEISEEEIPEEEYEKVAAGIEEGSVSGQSQFFISQREEKTEKPGFAYNFFAFMMLDYPDLLQKIIFYSLLIINFALILNIFVKVKIQDKKLILKTVFFVALLALFHLSDKESIISFIPHNLII